MHVPSGSLRGTLLKKSLVLFAVFALSLIPATCLADTFQGSVIRAQLIFLNDPAVTNPSLDPVNLLTGGTGYTGTRDTVHSGQEYVYDDGVATYSANFNAGGFTIRVKCDKNVTLATCNAEPGFEWIFKDSVFATSNFAIDPSTNLLMLPIEDPNDLSQIALVDFISSPLAAVLGAPPGTFDLTLKNSKFVVDVTPATVTPEPGSLMLLGTGMLGVIGAARRRFRK